MSAQPTPRDTAASLLAAVHFAAHKHSRQRRKDPHKTPYINHPIAVAELLTRVGGVADVATLQAAILHDTLEDTETTPQELGALFGQEVRSLVQEVTDNKSLPPLERKRVQITQARQLSDAAKRIRLADKIANIGDITSVQPESWTPQRKRDFLEWAVQVVAGCRGCSATLERHFDALVQAKRQELAVTAQTE